MHNSVETLFYDVSDIYAEINDGFIIVDRTMYVYVIVFIYSYIFNAYVEPSTTGNKLISPVWRCKYSKKNAFYVIAKKSSVFDYSLTKRFICDRIWYRLTQRWRKIGLISNK